MRCNAIVLRTAAIVFGCAASSAAFAAPDARGIWLNDTGRGAIEIKDCDDKLCGHVVWTRDATDTSRGCGKQIIGDAASQGAGLWDGGWVYSPEKKRRYNVELKPLNDGTLRVKGYAGSKFFSKTMIWTKASADLKRCDATSVDANANPQPATETASIAQAPIVKAPVVAAVPPVPAASAKVPAANATMALAAAQAAQTQPIAKAKSASSAPEIKSAVPVQQQPAPKTKVEPRVAQVDEADSEAEAPDASDLIDKLDGMEFGDGYGVKKLANGDCRLKVPFVTVKVRCKK